MAHDVAGESWSCEEDKANAIISGLNTPQFICLFLCGQSAELYLDI